MEIKGPMTAGETHDFAVSGKCGVPIDARAYALNRTPHNEPHH